MTLVLNQDKVGHVETPAEAAPETFELEETYWGYVIRPRGVVPAGVVIARGMSWMIGICALLGAAGLWLVPEAVFPSSDPATGRIGASVLLVGVAGLLLWLSTRGAAPELQVDRRLGELREVLRNRAGQPRLVARYAFAEIGSVHLDRAQMKPGQVRLVLRYGNTAQTFPVAAGPEARLTGLRDRLGQDILAGEGREPS